MIQAKDFIHTAAEFGFTLYSGVPCSYLKPFINYVIDSPDLQYVGAANEGDAVAIASGSELAGRRSVVMFQNSGFGNAINPLTSLNAIFKIPVLVITTLRGEPGGKPDEPQHALMGQITPQLFDLMNIPWEYFPTDPSEIAGALKRAVEYMDSERLPYGLIMKSGSVADHELKSRAAPKPLSQSQIVGSFQSSSPSEWSGRKDLLQTVQSETKPNDIVIATTGFTGRVLYSLEDRPNQLYMVGSMGCASSFALGVALAKPKHRVIVLDGDGAALMRMGNFATLGYERPSNLVHILIDNEAHDSTGGQSTVSHSIDFAGIAHSCGYPKVIRASQLEDVKQALGQKTSELTLIHIKTKTGASKDLPRPTVTPVQVAERLKAWMSNDPA